MYDITLISTEHVARGKCNPDELYKIIETINPEVIFEEETNDEKYREYYSERASFVSLEIQCIKKYKQIHNIKHIPVDIEPNQFLSFEEWDYLFDTFKRYDVHRRILKLHCALRDMEGFAYLNSDRCSTLFDEVKIVEKQIVQSSGVDRDRMVHLFELFEKEHDTRETAMLRNIYRYSELNEYNSAVFLLGYAHRKSVIKKISNNVFSQGVKLNWTFYLD